MKPDQTITKEIDLSKNWDITKKKRVIKPNSMVYYIWDAGYRRLKFIRSDQTLRMGTYKGMYKWLG